MALDLGVGDGASLVPQPGEPSLQLDNDGYYWSLHPLIEKLHSETGQYIDLYGDASFSGASLSALERMIAEAEKMIQKQSVSWQVHLGTQLRPQRKELYEVVYKVQVLSLLQKWREIVARAKELGKPVVCFGD
jgi:hypothetical protein